MDGWKIEKVIPGAARTCMEFSLYALKELKGAENR